MKKEHLIVMIEKTFEKARKKNGGEYADNSYLSRMKTYVNQKITEKVIELGNEKYYNPKFWKGSWMDEYVEESIDRYHADELSATRIEGMIHAVHAFASAVKEFKTFGKGTKKVRVGLKGGVKQKEGQLNRLHEEGVIDSKDHVTSMKPKGDELERVKAAIPNTVRNYDSIIKALDSQSHTGGRIKAELRLRVGDIDYVNKTKKYKKDKHGFNRRVQIKDEFLDFYREMERGKPKGAPLYPFFDRQGKQMDDDSASRHAQEILKIAVDKAGVNYEKVIEKQNRDGSKREVTVEMRFTSHSNRRGFAQGEYDKTRYWKKSKIIEAIGEYLNLQGSNKEKIIARIDNERDRLNYRNIKYRKPKRDFTWEQLRMLYVALQLGHSRIDIGKRYVDTDEPIWKRKKKLKTE
ncbi:hypothetical protein [Sporosarcina koreensis]|uniref:Phage integrase family protein n=1 Tax=Sporosarcina koreensis TaxID=334735 RepID=A0ABW0TTV3_9BACL